MSSSTQQNSQQPDLLFYFSDQHQGRLMGCAGDPLVQTPHMDQLAADGVMFENVYTSYPLCVPARCSMLTAHLPSRIVTAGNDSAIPNDQSTWLHSLAAAGYETVLCGRMHFNGVDQRHGFTRRIHGDITAPLPGKGAKFHKAGPVGRGVSMRGCCDIAGGGDSFVLAFDRSVVQAAIDYLDQPHDKPQCIVLGTYGPHFPYVAPTEYFKQYQNSVVDPASWDENGKDENPFIDGKRQRMRHAAVSDKQEPVTTDVMRACRAAYYGMITEQDRLVGQVRNKWNAYLENAGHHGVFMYGSDHGDTCGEHGIFGKQTFYEGSVRIPLIAAGDGIMQGKRINTPVSIMDIGPTLLDFAGAAPVPEADGRSLAVSLQTGQEPDAVPVLSEWVQLYEDKQVVGRMVRMGDWKLIHYRHPALPDQLFDVVNDPDELHNRVSDEPGRVDELMTLLTSGWDPQQIAADVTSKVSHIDRIRRATIVADGVDPSIDLSGDFWPVPTELAQLPEIAI